MGFLVACGWQVEAHRFRLGRHDLDLVIRRDRLVAFVEVKTRRSLRCGSAVESVSALKRRLIERVALSAGGSATGARATNTASTWWR